MVTISRSAGRVLRFIYAYNNVNIGAVVPLRLIDNGSFDLDKALKELFTEGLLNDIRKPVTKNTGAIYCKVTPKGEAEVKNSFKFFVLKSLMTKEQFSWDDLKKVIIQEFNFEDIPAHLRKFGMQIIQEFVCIGVLTYQGRNFHVINATFTVNQEKFNKKQI